MRVRHGMYSGEAFMVTDMAHAVGFGGDWPHGGEVGFHNHQSAKGNPVPKTRYADSHFDMMRLLHVMDQSFVSRKTTDSVKNLIREALCENTKRTSTELPVETKMKSIGVSDDIVSLVVKEYGKQLERN